MKIKVLWGFIGDADKLKSDSRQVRKGQVFDDVEAEYAHLLIGKGLAAEVKSEPSSNKQANSPASNLPAPSKGSPAAPAGNKAPPAIAPLTDKTALLARAKELGIDAKGNWGVPKLQAEIAAAEAAKATAGGAGDAGQAGAPGEGDAPPAPGAGDADPSAGSASGSETE